MGGDDVEQRGVHVLAHAGGAAHIHVRAALQPGMDLGATRAQAVLHVELFGLVARERQVQRVQLAALQGQLPFGLVQEIGIEVLGAEEQPVTALGAGFRALLHEAAERCHAGARADHQDVAIGIGRHAEAVVGFDVHRRSVAFGKRGQKAAGRTQVRMPMRLVGDLVHRQMHLIAHALAAGGDGIQPRVSGRSAASRPAWSQSAGQRRNTSIT